MSTNNRFNRHERRAALALALLFFLRMLGLFMLLPVLSLYVDKLDHSTPFLIGLALGIYALTQAIFQIPMGHLSDRVGRKPVIAAGLVIFVIGSGLAAITQNIFFIIIGRALQGCGAISSAALAMAADLSRDSQRTKVMALIGVSIGLAFSAAFVLGPLIDGRLGLSGLFTVVGGLGLAAIIILFALVPDPTNAAYAQQESEIADSAPTHQTKALGISIFGGFFLHAILAASFVVVPLHLASALALPSSLHYQVYLPVILASLVVVGPMVMFSNRHGRQKMFITATISALIAGLAALLLLPASLTASYVGLGIFFIGFNYLEAALPSQVSREAHLGKRGKTMGNYASLQFLGTFLGASLGGFVLGQFGHDAVLVTAIVLAILWLSLSTATNRLRIRGG